jgi:thiol:disulfide interchange protein DsbD
MMGAMLSILRWSLLSLCVLLPGAGELAQDSAGAHISVSTAVAAPENAGPGGEFRVEVTFRIEEGWHFYGPGDFYDQGTLVVLEGGIEGLTVGEFKPTREPTPHKYEWDDAPRMEFKGEVTYSATIRVAAGVAAGVRTLTGKATVNLCNDTGCLPPEDLPFTVAVTMVDAPAVIAAAKVEPPPVVPAPGGIGGGSGGSKVTGAVKGAVTTASAVVEETTGISLGFLWTALVAGWLTILTPCVFPMLPLTVSLLTKRAQKEPEKIVRNAFVYGLGMFLSLAGIGLLMALVLGVAPTELALNPWFNLAIFGFLLLLAMSLFGAFDIQMPAFLLNWSQSKAGGTGSAGLFFMGMTLAFTSFSCAAPFVGGLLVAAQTDLTRGIVGMSVYAGAFTAPFFTLALFPGLLQRLPKSGGWLNSVKVVMGFVEVAAAFKFLRVADIYWNWGVFSFELVLAVWIACALGCALYLFGLLVLPHDTRPESIGVARMLTALLFLTLALFMLPGLFRQPLPSVIESFILTDGREVASAGRTSAEPKVDWKRFEDDLDGAMAEAVRSKRPVFIDFTGVG